MRLSDLLFKIAFSSSRTMILFSRSLTRCSKLACAANTPCDWIKKIVDIMKKQQDQLHHQNGQLNSIKQVFEKLSRENMVLKENISKKDKIISELQENITKILTKQCSD